MTRARPGGRALKFRYAALKGMTALSFATGRLVGVSGARGLRFKLRRRGLFAGSLPGPLDHPERPVQTAMKATASRAAGSSHTGALSGLSDVAFCSAWSSASLAEVMVIHD